MPYIKTMNNETEVTKFLRATRTTVRLIRQIAANASEDYRPLEQKALRAVDRLYDLARFQNDPGAATAQCQGLHAAWRFATRAGAAARKEARSIELVRLRRAERDSRRDEDGIIRELRISAARQGRTF